MNKITNDQRINSVVCFIPLIFFVVIISCERESLGYLTEVPDIERFEYFSINEWSDIVSDSLVTQPIYKGVEDSTGSLARIGFIEEINDSLLWVADPLKAQVTEISTTVRNSIRRIVLDTGKGPGEIVRPSSIFYASNVDSLIYIIDSGQSCILVINNDRVETKRECLVTIPKSIVSTYFKVLSRNKYVWNSDIHKNFVTGVWDSSGNLSEGLVKRLIPLGYQPITYNNVVYDIDERSSKFVYSYKGLPLVFIKNDDDYSVINLLPNQNLKNFNVPLDLQPEETNISVKNIIRDLYVINDKVFVSLFTSLFVIDIAGEKQTMEYIFKRDDDTDINFHMFRATEKNVYLIDQYHNDIYSIPTTKLIN